ncbi:hypothetical protein B7494_g6144 [Chlorociboria aeruginascens]|nr:hypothetical protein B7494_g6144 [Chlorociboria aeruginascens]
MSVDPSVQNVYVGWRGDGIEAVQSLPKMFILYAQDQAEARVLSAREGGAWVEWTGPTATGYGIGMARVSLHILTFVARVSMMRADPIIAHLTLLRTGTASIRAQANAMQPYLLVIRTVSWNPRAAYWEKSCPVRSCGLHLGLDPAKYPASYTDAGLPIASLALKVESSRSNPVVIYMYLQGSPNQFHHLDEADNWTPSDAKCSGASDAYETAIPHAGTMEHQPNIPTVSLTNVPIKIVRLDGVHCPSPEFNIPHTYVEYPNSTSLSIIPARLSGATVAITTRVPISAATLDACPSLKHIAILAIGCDHVDLEACKQRGVAVSNVPAASNESVAEHAIALYFAVRRKVVLMHELTVKGEEWPEKGTLKAYFGEMPGTCRIETMGVIGAGELGNRVANIGRALGMTVLLADRKGIPDSAVRPGRTPFTTVLRTSTILMLTCPLSPSTLSLIAAPELALMHPESILINVARGGIVVEADLVEALRHGRMGGAATDVFVEEPAGEENALVKAAREKELQGRLVLSPHVAWCARSSIEKLRRTVQGNVEAWFRGEVRNSVV